MADERTGTAQRYARHVPTGAIWDANDVPEELRQGPWCCTVRECAAPYGRIKNKTTTIRGPRSGCFVIEKDATHDMAFPHRRVPNHPATDRVPDGSRLHVHHLRGLTMPPVERITTKGESTGAVRTVYDYGPDIHSAAGMVEFEQKIAATPSLADTDEFWFADTHYTWHELAYQPTLESFRLLRTRIREQVNPRRVYFVRGYAKYEPYPENRNPELLLLRVMSHLRTDDTPPPIELWVHMPNTPVYQARLTAVRSGTPVAVVANRRDPDRDYSAPELLLDQPAQVEII